MVPSLRGLDVYKMAKVRQVRIREKNRGNLFIVNYNLQPLTCSIKKNNIVGRDVHHTRVLRKRTFNEKVKKKIKYLIENGRFSFLPRARNKDTKRKMWIGKCVV